VRAVVLCAGLGTRLRPLTETWPKPAVPLLGQPLLRYAFQVLRAGGVTEVGINTHHLAERMEKTAGEEARRAQLGLTVEREPVIQGTGGGIRGLRRLVDGESFLVWNGDILFGLDVAAMVREHRASGAAATMVLMAMPPGERYGAVEVDPAGQVRRIAGQGPGGPSLASWHFTGVHVMEPVVFEWMAREGEEDINRTVYPKMISAGLTVRAAFTEAYWSDLGTPARYLATQAALLGGRVPLGPFAGASPFERATRHGALWLVTDARADGASTTGPAYLDAGAVAHGEASLGPNVYVAPRERVPGGAWLESAAVLEGAAVKSGERLVRTIAWDGQRLAAG
jgi:mannose-1-phosphate guanylyltransferase